MEDLDAVDYSSDRLESSDIWDVPGGGVMEQVVDIPRLSQEVLDSASFMPLGLESIMSLSDFLVFSPVVQLPVEPHVDPSSHLPDDLLGNSSWKEVGAPFSRNLGFPASVFQVGFEAVKGSDQVTADGVDG